MIINTVPAGNPRQPSAIVLLLVGGSHPADPLSSLTFTPLSSYSLKMVKHCATSCRKNKNRTACCLKFCTIMSLWTCYSFKSEHTSAAPNFLLQCAWDVKYIRESHNNLNKDKTKYCPQIRGGADCEAFARNLIDLRGGSRQDHADNISSNRTKKGWSAW